MSVMAAVKVRVLILQLNFVLKHHRQYITDGDERSFITFQRCFKDWKSVTLQVLLFVNPQKPGGQWSCKLGVVVQQYLKDHRFPLPALTIYHDFLCVLKMMIPASNGGCSNP